MKPVPERGLLRLGITPELDLAGDDKPLGPQNPGGAKRVPLVIPDSPKRASTRSILLNGLANDGLPFGRCGLAGVAQIDLVMLTGKF